MSIAMQNEINALTKRVVELEKHLHEINLLLLAISRTSAGKNSAQPSRPA